MSTESTLNKWTFFTNGQRVKGAQEFTPPAPAITTSDYRTGATDAPIPVDDGMEALTCSVKFSGIDLDMLQGFGFIAGTTRRFIAYEGYLSNGQVLGATHECEGFIKTITPDARGNAGLSEAGYTAEIALKYWKHTVQDWPVIEVDAERCIRRVNGIDVLSSIRSKVRI